MKDAHIRAMQSGSPWDRTTELMLIAERLGFVMARVERLTDTILKLKQALLEARIKRP